MLLHVQKTSQRLQQAVRETEFLRLKRARLGPNDFESLKVIGRGAFGEVRHCLFHSVLPATQIHIGFAPAVGLLTFAYW